MSSPRKDALSAFKAAIAAANPADLVSRNIRLHGTRLIAHGVTLNLSRYQRILVVGGGKAVVGMVSGLERVLGRWITDGAVNAPEQSIPGSWSRRVSFTPSTHPFPSMKGSIGVRKMLSMVGTPDSRDLVICLISGGASAMMPLPAKGLTLPEKRAITQLLSAAGAGVGEVNTVRRHLSQIKGGRLAETLFPATVLSLIISDVVDNKLEDIGSGPTAPDPSTYAHALRVLQKYGLWERAPSTARQIIRNGIEDPSKETPKPGSRAFRRVFNVIVGDNRVACLAAAKSLRRNGYRTIVLTQKLQGEAREAGRLLSAVVSGIGRDQFSLPRPVALVAGGETTVVVRGSGRGGRNQELMLSAAIGIDGMKNVVVLSGGTDGLDGTTEAAGAFADGSTFKRALAKGLVPQTYLDNNDSYSFFRKVRGQIVTGPTGTNVSDITIMAAGAAR